MKRTSMLLAFLMLACFQAEAATRNIFAVGKGPMAAESPFSDYDARIVFMVLFIGILVTVLVAGGILVVNLGLMSRREEDRVGGRAPSDVGILKSNVWPEAPYEGLELPAVESPEGEEESFWRDVSSHGTRPQPSQPAALNGGQEPLDEVVSSGFSDDDEESVTNTGRRIRHLKVYEGGRGSAA